MTTKTAILCLLNLALALTMATPTLASDLPPPPTCHDTDNENGFGGTHVYCDYSCKKESTLSAAVLAHDKDASAAVWTACGGTKAYCDHGTQTCAGSSTTYDPPVAQSSGTDDCHGRSYEFSDSAVTIACGATPGADVCDVLPDNPVCNGGVPLREFCWDGRIPQDRYGLMEQALLLLGPVESFVVATVDEAGGAWVAFDGEVCTTGTMEP